MAEPPFAWNVESSHIDLPAHSAPLGLAFVPETAAWPKEYRGDLIVAFHGSWNRTRPIGYKLARIKLDNRGNFEGTEDFISGWLATDGKTALGRPADILIGANGIMYVSDDKAGVIYKVQHLGSALPPQSDNIRLDTPKAGDAVALPLKIRGSARGSWYFEASFPVEIYDADWKLLGQSFAQALGEWMTEDFVPFESDLSFEHPAPDPGLSQAESGGWLVFKKNNPSGLPENGAQFNLPIKFKN